MSHYKGRPGAKAIERDFPHIVEMGVPLGGFGSKLNAMQQWHEARGIRAIHSTGRRDENNRDYIRWCFADPVAAKEFAEAFADMVG
jgi:uncharacterized protein CbrC (UPF0167 family)